MSAYKVFFLDHRSHYLNSLGDALAQWGNRVCTHSNWNMDQVEASIAFFRPDILFTVGSDTLLNSRELDALPSICRKYGVFHTYWATEDKIHLDNWSLPFVQRIQPDLVWTIHPECVKTYEELGISAGYMNFGFNRRLFPAKPFFGYEPFELSFVGTTHLQKPTFRHDSLRQLLFPLVEANRKVNIWGFGWTEEREMISRIFGIEIPPDWLNGFLPYKQTCTVYHQSKIMLGVQNAVDQVTQRTFEILGTGAFMIANRTEELSRLFTDGKEIVLSDSPEHTLELVSYYLARPEKRYRIGQQARQNILNNHTYFHRLSTVWAQLESLVESKRSVRNR